MKRSHEYFKSWAEGALGLKMLNIPFISTYLVSFIPWLLPFPSILWFIKVISCLCYSSSGFPLTILIQPLPGRVHWVHIDVY